MVPSTRPAWLVEALDVVERRGGLLRAAVGGLVLVGLVLTILVPSVLPPRPLVGAAVALAAILIGLAITIAVDAGDATIRGPRHVRAVGGELVGVLPSRVSPAAADELASAVLAARPGRRVVLGLSGTGRGVDVAAWTDALGVATADRDASVLVVDVASGATPNAGLLEVVRDGASLGHTVTFERDVKLARLGAGRDLDGAIRAAADLPARLPKDLEVLLVALPPLADADVLAAAGALDAVLLLARSDATPRVRLQAGIEALESVGTVAQVVLVDDRTARPPAAEPAAGPPAAGEPEPGPEPERVSTAEGPVPAQEPAARVPEPDGVEEPGAVEGPDAVTAPDAVDEQQPPPVTADQPPPVTADQPERVAEPEPAPDEPEPVAEPESVPDEPESVPDEPEPVPDEPAATDRWAGPHLATPRAELERRPSPSVRVVRDLPPTSRDPRPTPPPFEPGGPAAPRDPDVVSGAAAASLAARLASTQPMAPEPVTPQPADAAPEPPPSQEPEPAAEPEPTVGAAEPVVEVEEPEPPVGAAEPVVEVAAPEPIGEEDTAPVAEVPPEPLAELPEPEAPPESAASEPEAVSADPEDEVVDPTDEIPAVRDARLARPPEEDDPLRTTAQLALLMDELHERDDDAEA